MAIVLFPGNGAGIGHLSRAVRVCEALTVQGYRPVIISQGIYPDFFARWFPGTTVSALAQAGLVRIGRRLDAYLRFGSTSVLIEDTYPTRLRTEPSVTRVLLVRPVTFPFLKRLRGDVSRTYQWTVLADHSDSPTWPYTPEETAEIKSWSDWKMVGPIFRVASEQGVSLLRGRYHIETGQNFYVFTMGGGGTQKNGQGDIGKFINTAISIGSRLRRCDPNCRLLFVKGPLFPADVELPRMFESVPYESMMPELLHLATGAIIRSGYNTLWECLSARTPVYPIIGKTYEEPVDERLNCLRAMGLLSEDSVERWCDEDWRADYSRRVTALVGRWDGSPDPIVFRAILSASHHAQSVAQPLGSSPSPAKGAASHGLTTIQASLRSIRGPKHFVLRLDDVTRLDYALRWMLDTCRKWHMPASLEVIPYLSELTAADLNEIDNEGTFFEVSQHGYAHMLQYGPGGIIGEYVSEGMPLPDYVQRNLSRSCEDMRVTFGRRFHGGYSPPYDGIPTWLLKFWGSIGGRYISAIHPRTVNQGIAIIRVGVDPWDWSANTPRPLESVLQQIESEMRHTGYAGLVIHPEVVWDRGQCGYVDTLLEFLAQAGVTGCSLSSLVGALDPFLQMNQQECSMNNTKVLAKAQDLVYSGDQATRQLLNPRSGRLFIINTVGERILEVCDGKSFDDIVSSVEQCFDGVTRQEIAADVKEFLDQAMAAGIVRWQDQ
jgi:hypothetical protein